MSERKTIRVGLIGCGFYAQNHLHAWQDLHAEGAELVAVCDLDAEKVGKAATQFQAKAYTDAKAMLDNETLDLVDITTQMGSHRILAALAAERGIGAIIQKPLAPDWNE